MPPTDTALRAFDRAVLAAAAFAVRSPKLDAGEKRRLRILMTKGARKGKQGWSMADRVECLQLTRKGAPERVPSMPPWLRRRLERWLPPVFPPTGPALPPVREPSPVDPLEQLRKAADMRGSMLTERQYVERRRRILENPELAAWGIGEGVDPLDRVALWRGNARR